MIYGSVNARYEAIISLTVLGAGGKQQILDMIIDTGFNGALMLPTSLIALLGLPWLSNIGAILGHGKIEQMDVFDGTVMWGGLPLQVLVYASDTTPMVGTALLAGHDVRIHMIPGGRVEIEPVP